MYPPRKRAPHYVDTHCIHEDHNRDVRGQAPLPARTQLGELSRVTTTADTNTDERSATGQRQGEGAGLRRDI